MFVFYKVVLEDLYCVNVVLSACTDELRNLQHNNRQEGKRFFDYPVMMSSKVAL